MIHFRRTVTCNIGMVFANRSFYNNNYAINILAFSLNGVHSGVTYGQFSLGSTGTLLVLAWDLQAGALENIFLMTCIGNHIYTKQWDVITHPYHNFNGVVAKLSLVAFMICYNTQKAIGMDSYPCQPQFICQKWPLIPISRMYCKLMLVLPL